MLRRIPAGGEHKVIVLIPEILRCTRAIAVEQARHFRREQHFGAASRGFVHRIDERAGMLLRVDTRVRLVQGDLRHAAMSWSSLPARSSAIRSSHPPTWVPAMKICGTVV